MTHDQRQIGRGRGGPLAWTAICWAIGLLIARMSGAEQSAPWLIAAAALLGIGMAVAKFRRSARRIVLLTCTAGAVTLLAVAWWVYRVEGQIVALGSEPHLLAVEGTIDAEPRTRIQPRGAMGRFDYRPPQTTFTLWVDRVIAPSGRIDVDCGLLITLPAYDGRLAEGDRVRCEGWASSFSKPMNPGELNFARMMAERGVVGRLSLESRGNLDLITPAAERGGWPAWRQAFRRKAAAALHAGLWHTSDAPTAALLDAMLLGDRRGDLGELDDAFRRSGLAHLLAISGMHLGILVLGAGLLGRTVGLGPRSSIWLAMLSLGVYLMIVPPAVPVVRAGIMAAIGCVWFLLGRRTSATATLGLAALILLIWRPGDLFTAGFQLSFTIVAALVLFVPRLSEWLAPRDPFVTFVTPMQHVRRKLADYAAVTIVAWCTAMPLVAFHFQTVSPLSGLATAIMLPVVTLLLWLGYLKMAVVAVWGDAAQVLGPLLWWAGRGMTELVTWSASWPGVSFSVPGPSVAWLTTALMLMGAALGGWFRGRAVLLGAGMSIVVLWLAWPAMTVAGWGDANDEPAALRVNMFAVGDGSCFLIRSGGEAMIFDCGSSNYLDITTAAVGPALRKLGIMRVSTLVLSHPDTDHFSGCLELVDRFGVERVITTKAFLDAAEQRPTSAAAFALAELAARNVQVQVVYRGHRERFGDARLEVMWPPLGRSFERHNDSSVMLAIDAGGRRVLFTGDVQQEAMTLMLDEGMDLQADVLELPHHGSFVPAAPAWVATVDPNHVLQSTGRARLRNDKWRDHLADVERHVTAWHGMVELAISPTGEIFSRQTHEGSLADGDLE